MTDLFSTQPSAPLAEQLRPASIADVIGQDHLLGPKGPLTQSFKAKSRHSFILWGPPGVGKTTIARLSAQALGCEFISLSAVMAGVKEIREAIVRAQLVLDQRGRATVLFVDEIHRFNKSQQDALLPYVESGLISFIGATTENPSFEVNSALLSRAQVYVLKPLDAASLDKLYQRALTHLQGVTLDATALKMAQGMADGDGRRFLNLLEQLKVAAMASSTKEVGPDLVKSLASEKLRRFDKNGEEFYDQISALHKSIRGSNPNAALYWLARMLDGGADARYLARRLVRMASEEIGNADPRALPLAIAAAQSYERLGSPEGDLALAHVAAFLAVAPKSNAVYSAWNQAKAFVRENGSHPVPLHLRNAPTQLMADLGYKKGYRYAHDEPDAYAAGEAYFPEALPEMSWYAPVPRGLEAQIGARMHELRQRDEAEAASGKARKPLSAWKPPKA